MQYRIEVTYRDNASDPEGSEALREAHELGIDCIRAVRSSTIYILDGDLDEEEARLLAGRLFADPVVQRFRILTGNGGEVGEKKTGSIHSIEISRRRGVMDPVRQSALKAAKDLGLGDRVDSVRTARKYIVDGATRKQDLELLACKALANRTIEDIHIDNPDVQYPLKNPGYEFRRMTVPLRDAGAEELRRISREGMLSLSLEEMETIRERFRTLDRDPTDLELEILAQTWSEHCVHKTLKGRVTYHGPVPDGWEEYLDKDGRLVIDNLLKHTVVRATRSLDKPWCLSVFSDNAGIVDFDGENALCFKVETHNHPSAIEPYGGANTGVGGVVRDTLGTGLGARPVMNTDVFCLGPPDMDDGDVPRGALHPKRVLRGVVSGVRDYGNRMGIPTANGAVYFDRRYTGNCLVFCGNVGLIPHDKIDKKAHAGDYILVAGGRTGRDGIHGATFSSVELNTDSEEDAGGAVQIGDPITDKKLLDTILQARDMGLYSCITDCGAGGLSSAVGEMGAETGVDAEIGDVPLKYKGLSYSEIWISEAQERMVLAVPPQNLEKILEVFAAEDVEATVIGRFTGDGMLRVRYRGNPVAELDMDFLHNGLPGFRGDARWRPPMHQDPLLDGPAPGTDASAPARACRITGSEQDCETILNMILAAPNVRSREWIVRQYDHEVQGQTVIKPLVGVDRDGPGDAAVITPVLGSFRGAAVACGMNPRYGDIDPYHAAAGAIDEALRNITSVGGDPSRTAILDNFCWGNTGRPEQLGTLVRAALACHDYAVAFGVPFISGKDSLNNEYNIGGETISIPPTLLISAVSIVDDIRRAQTMDLKEPGNVLYLVGNTYPELGGSHYYDVMGLIGRSVPQVRAAVARKNMQKLHGAIAGGLVRACHDLSEGGLAVAAAEMCFAGGLGAELDIRDLSFRGDESLRRNDVLLFSESNSRFLAEVKEENIEDFERAMAGAVFHPIGVTDSSGSLTVTGMEGSVILKSSVRDLKRAWQTPLF